VLALSFYILTALLLQRYFSPKRWMLCLIGVAASLFCVFGFAQFFGTNPFALYPAGYNYYDADISYLGKYWSTIGNTGLCVALLVMITGMFAALMIRGYEKRPLAAIPLFLAVFSIFELGGEAGMLALAVGLPCLLPLCVRSMKELAYALEVAAVVVCAVGTSQMMLFHEGSLQFAWSAGLFYAVSVCLLLVGSLLLRKSSITVSTATLQKILLSSVVVLFSIAFVALCLASDLPAGFLQEAQQLLHGKWNDDFGSGRLYIWRNVWGLVKETPLLGGGPDTLGLRGVSWDPVYHETLETTIVTQIDAAHNEFLHIIVNQGILGLLAYLMIIVQTMCDWVRNRDNLCCLMCGAAVVFYLLQSVFGISSPISAPYFWMAIGCLKAAAMQKDAK